MGNELFSKINDRLSLIRAGKRPGKSLMSYEESQFMWNLGFVLVRKHRASAYKVYEIIRSFITFHGVFMGVGYDIGVGSIWFVDEDERWDRMNPQDSCW